MKLIQTIEIMMQAATKMKIDPYFWVTMGISAFVAILMVIVFWALPPKKDKVDKQQKEEK